MNDERTQASSARVNPERRMSFPGDAAPTRGGIAPEVGTRGGGAGPLPVVVRRATPGDGDAVLSFTRGTFDGWDYIPFVWEHWLVASDGVLLAAVPREPEAGSGLDLDLFGRPLTSDRPIAIARVTMLSPYEAWLEGLRVDPGVRRRSVATSMHVASLAWARAQGATAVRYATGEDNAGSHRIGEQHGFEMLGAWRRFALPGSGGLELDDAADPIAYAGVGVEGHQIPGADDPAQSSGGFGSAGWAAGLDESDEPNGFDAHEHFAPDFPGVEDDPGGARAREAQAAERVAVREALGHAGLVLPADTAVADLDRWWDAVESDETLRRAGGLYEARPWRFQSLTRERFGEHVRSGDVLVVGGPSGRWGLVIRGSDEYWRPRDQVEAALAVGDGGAVLEIAESVFRVLDVPLQLRLPHPAPPLVAGHEDAFGAVGFRWDDEAVHVLGRSLGPDDTFAVPGPAGTLTLGDKPRRLAAPRQIGD